MFHELCKRVITTYQFVDAKKFWVVQVNFGPSKLPSYSIQTFPFFLLVTLLEASQKACATKIAIRKPKHFVVVLMSSSNGIFGLILHCFSLSGLHGWLYTTGQSD